MLFNKSPHNHGGPGPERPPALDQVPTASGVPAQSVIDARLTIIGDLLSEGDVQVDGHVCGNVRCSQLVVGKDAVITGAISAEQAVVRGRVTGTVRATLVILQDTAHVESEIGYKLLSVDEGARFEGMARHSPNPRQDKDTVSSLTELRQTMPKPENGKAPGAAAEANAGKQPQPTMAAPGSDRRGRRNAEPEIRGLTANR